MGSMAGWKFAEYVSASTNRLILNLLFCATLVLALPRWAQVVCYVVLLLFTQVACFYHAYFGRALSWVTIRTQIGEGIDSVMLDRAFILPGVLAGSLLWLVVKLALLWAQKRRPIPWKVRLPCSAATAILYAALMLSFNSTGSTRMASLGTWMSFDRVGVAYGYVATWIGESIYVSNAELLDKALQAREQRDDRITPVVGTLDLPGHLVLLQVESLDWHVLGLERDGQPVTPRLNALREEAIVFQVRAIHRNGSADADFVMLHGCMVAPGVINYKVPGFPHDDTLPAVARDAGLPMTVFHGYKGAFYNRRPAFDQMDFEHIVMLEEMVDDFGLEPKKWHAVPDGPVLMLSARLLSEADAPRSHLIITYTSHTPFVMLPDDYAAPFSNPLDRVETRFLNTMHYVDDAIGAYLDALPEGTTVVIYADHEGAAGYPERQRARGEPEVIPLIVWRKGEDLSPRQTGGMLPVDRVGAIYGEGPGNWSLIDAANWVRAWLEARRPGPDSPPENP